MGFCQDSSFPGITQSVNTFTVSKSYPLEIRPENLERLSPACHGIGLTTFFFSNFTVTEPSLTAGGSGKRLLYSQALVIIQPRNFAPPYTLHKAQIIKKKPLKTCTCMLTATLTLATEATQCHPWLEIGGVACSTHPMQCHWP